VKTFFQDRLTIVMNDFAAKGINTALYADTTKDFSDFVRIIPTSAKTDEGLPDLPANLLSTAQTEMADDLRL
jgi:translation initiation factor 5B